MLLLQTVVHCSRLQAQVSFWFTSALIKFPPKHSCNPNYGGKDQTGWIGRKRNCKVFQIINWDVEELSTSDLR